MLGQKLAMEAVGTFFLMLAIVLAVLGPGSESIGSLAPFVIAATLIAVIYAGGHISKAQYNPAVSFAFTLLGVVPKRELIPLIVVQIAAAAAAVGVSGVLAGPEGLQATAMELDPLRTIIAEALFTFALVYVILTVASDPKLAGNQFYGVAIGLVVLGGAYAVGPISGGAFNPAVAVGLAMTGIVGWADLWMHGAGALVGAVVAALAFRYIVGEPNRE